MSHVYRLAAHKLISDIELPELTAWDGESEPAGLLHFRLGRTDAKDGDAYVVPGPNRIVIEKGACVTVEPDPAMDLADMRALLMGPVQAVLWHQRGFLPLHASAVAAKSGAIAISGPSGAGKSTLAAALGAKACPVLADDIAIVDSLSGELLTGQRRLRLWRSALEQLGAHAEGLERAMSRSEKYLFEAEQRPVPQRHKLSHVCLLARGERRSRLALERVKGQDAIFGLINAVHMLPAAHELGLAEKIFSAVTVLQRNGVQVWRFTLPDDLAALDEAAETLLTQLDDG